MPQALSEQLSLKHDLNSRPAKSSVWPGCAYKLGKWPALTGFKFLRQATQAALEEARARAEEEERKAREFHAHPMPATTKPPTPLEHSSPVFTMPEPFHLEGEKRHAEVLHTTCWRITK